MAMIRCSICSAENHHLAAVCTACGGYLQNRQENLDLFATCGGVIERPGRAFRTIALARRKNGASLVAAVSGVAIVFCAFWAIAAAEYTPNTISLFAAGFLLGPFAGVALLVAFATLFKAMAAAQGLTVAYRNAYAAFAYALVPLLLSLVTLFPLEVVAFGRYFFTAQPTPYALRPVMYVTLVGLDGLVALWTLFLLVSAARVLLDRSWWKAVVTVVVPLLLLLGGVAGALRLALDAPGGT